MARAVATMSGVSATSRHIPPTTSKARLAHREAWSARGDPRCTNGRPATGRTLSRWLETSVRLGTTIAWTDSRSRAHMIRRSSFELPNAPSAKITTSAFVASMTAAALPVLPRTGMPASVSSPAPEVVSAPRTV